MRTVLGTEVGTYGNGKRRFLIAERIDLLLGRMERVQRYIGDEERIAELAGYFGLNACSEKKMYMIKKIQMKIRRLIRKAERRSGPDRFWFSDGSVYMVPGYLKGCSERSIFRLTLI